MTKQIRPEPQTFYLLWCTTCTEDPQRDNAMPFGSDEERGKWASAHMSGTGHLKFICVKAIREPGKRDKLVLG